MTSNFDFLKSEFPVLANFGCLAEQYCYADSNSCLMKLGMIGVTIVNLFFTYDNGLLDPINIHDISLIAFGIDGKLYPACAYADCWDAIRVLLSIRVFGLNRISLVDARNYIRNDREEFIRNIAC